MKPKKAVDPKKLWNEILKFVPLEKEGSLPLELESDDISEIWVTAKKNIPNSNYKYYTCKIVKSDKTDINFNLFSGSPLIRDIGEFVNKNFVGLK